MSRLSAIPGANGAALPAAPDPQVNDAPHDHAAWLAAQAQGGGVRLQYSKADIPSYRAYAQTYALCDNYFTDVASQSEPNHLHLIAAAAPLIDISSAHRTYVKPGMQWAAERIPAIAAGPPWPKMAVIVTWDDWGGWYDHVPPPRVTSWSGGEPAGYAGSQFRYGNRVPCLIISPYARAGVNHTFYSHVSVVKFCLRLFGLKSWSARMP